jgi:hypothetical protein
MSICRYLGLANRSIFDVGYAKSMIKKQKKSGGGGGLEKGRREGEKGFVSKNKQATKSERPGGENVPH